MGVIKRVLLPRGSYCYVCGGEDGGDIPGLCSRCFRLMGAGGPRCSVCRRALAPAVGSHHAPGDSSAEGSAPAGGRCRECLLLPPPYMGVTSVGRYEGLLRSTVRRFKFGGETYLARPLARALAGALLADGVRAEAVVPVPPSPAGFRRRGFDQAGLLGRLLRGYLDLPLVPALLRSPGSRQTRADQLGRWRRGAPSYKGRPGALPPGSTVLLVDDVVTSGATIYSCTSILLSAGAAAVWCAVLADTPRQGAAPQGNGSLPPG